MIGTGFGRTVAQTFHQTDGCEVVDIVSPRDAAATAELCGRRDIDLVAVHSPPHLHRRDVEIALHHGHHVVCDKPFGHDLADARAMHAAASTSEGLALTTFELRHESWRTTVGELLAADAIGAVRSVLWLESSSSWATAPTGWQADRALGGGWLGASGSHAIDTLQRWLGDLHVHGADLVPLHSGPDSADGSARVLAEGPTGARCTLITTGDDAVAAGRRVVVIGSKGVLTSDGRTIVELQGNEWPAHVARPAAVTNTFAIALGTWCAAVREAVRTGDPAEVATFDDAVRTAVVLHKIRVAGGWLDGGLDAS